jgi:hypothetical protein
VFVEDERVLKIAFAELAQLLLIFEMAGGSDLISEVVNLGLACSLDAAVFRNILAGLLLLAFGAD